MFSNKKSNKNLIGLSKNSSVDSFPEIVAQVKSFVSKWEKKIPNMLVFKHSNSTITSFRQETKQRSNDENETLAKATKLYKQPDFENGSHFAQEGSLMIW